MLKQLIKMLIFEKLKQIFKCEESGLKSGKCKDQSLAKIKTILNKNKNILIYKNNFIKE